MLNLLGEVDWSSIVAGVLGGGTLATVLTLIAARKKTDAETAVTVANAWESLLLPLREEVKRLAEQHEDCEKKNDALEEQAVHMRREIERLKLRVEQLEGATGTGPGSN